MLKKFFWGNSQNLVSVDFTTFTESDSHALKGEVLNGLDAFWVHVDLKPPLTLVFTAKLMPQNYELIFKVLYYFHHYAHLVSRLVVLIYSFAGIFIVLLR